MSHVKINHYSSCDECRMNNVTHKMGSVLAIDCARCLGGETVRIYKSIIKESGVRGVLDKVANEAELLAKICREPNTSDNERLLLQVAWMESALDLLKLTGDTFEKVELFKKDCVLKQEVGK